MIVRDKDVLQELSQRTDCTVCISVPCVDEDVWRSSSRVPRPPMKRLRAVRELVDAGIHAGVLMNPIVPGISSKPSLIEATVKAIADHGAKFVGCNVMYLQDGTRDHFMRWLPSITRSMVEGYRAPLRAEVPADGVPRRGEAHRQRHESGRTRSRAR